MSEFLPRGVRFPGKYLQGPGLLDTLGQEVAVFASRALVLVDGGIFEDYAARIQASMGEQVACQLHRFAGECTLAAAAAAVEDGRAFGAGVIVGVGGGKALDCAKAAAQDLGLPAVIVPTIATSDAPCSALAVIYNADGTVSHDIFLRRNPDLVVVDTAVIARAPARFLSAGIGDGLATWYEAASCMKSGATNCFAIRGLPLAYVIAAECREVLLEYGAAALAECKLDRAGPAMERVIEANILLSGIGFESGGVATAHAVHHGLTELAEVHHCLHGEKVAIGVLAGLLLNGDEDEFARVRNFCMSVGLPVTLAEIGIVDATEEKLLRVATRACLPGEIIHNEPFAVTPARVVAALKRLV